MLEPVAGCTVHRDARRSAVLQDEKRLLRHSNPVSRALNVIPPWLIPDLIPIIGNVDIQRSPTGVEKRGAPNGRGFFLAYGQTGRLDREYCANTTANNHWRCSQIPAVVARQTKCAARVALLKLTDRRRNDGVHDKIEVIQRFFRLPDRFPVVLSGTQQMVSWPSVAAHLFRRQQIWAAGINSPDLSARPSGQEMVSCSDTRAR